jgi:hypothetical protein
VTLAAPGWSLRSITAGGRDVIDANLELEGDITGMSVTFTDRVGEVTGAIGGGAPGEVAFVVLIPVDPRAPNGIHAARARQVVARTSSFRFSGVLPGDYAVVAFSATPETESIETLSAEALSVLAKQGTRVSIGEREKRAVSLTMVSRR